MVAAVAVMAVAAAAFRARWRMLLAKKAIAVVSLRDGVLQQPAACRDAAELGLGVR